MADGTSRDASRAEPLIRRSQHDRLSLVLSDRIGLSIVIGGFSGFLLGSMKGSQDAGFRFRAENAHRLPGTQKGWYFYHKSKNYNMALGGVKEGLRQALRFSFWAALYFIFEESFDRGRAYVSREIKQYTEGRIVSTSEESGLLPRQRDAISSMFAGMGTAGAFSARSGMPLHTAARTVKMGAVVGLGFGLAQDSLSFLTGRKIGYVELLGSWLGKNPEYDSNNSRRASL